MSVCGIFTSMLFTNTDSLKHTPSVPDFDPDTIKEKCTVNPTCSNSKMNQLAHSTYKLHAGDESLLEFQVNE